MNIQKNVHDCSYNDYILKRQCVEKCLEGKSLVQTDNEGRGSRDERQNMSIRNLANRDSHNLILLNFTSLEYKKKFIYY